MLILSYALGMCFSATSLEQLCLAWSQLHFGVYKEILARPLVLFGFEGQKLGILLENKTHLKSKIWKYVNSKSLAPFFILYSSITMKTNIERFRRFFDIEKWLRKSEALLLTFNTKNNLSYSSEVTPMYLLTVVTTSEM